MDDEQQFCLKWNNHQSTLVSVFDSLLRRNQLLDCTLAAEGRSMKAHKVILSACSPYFESLLADYYDKHPVFILKDVKFKELEAMMDYMYRGEVNVSQDQLGPLLKAAESLQIKGLSDNRRGDSRSTNDNERRREPAAPPREKSPPPAPSLPQVKGLIIEQKKEILLNNREGSQSPGRRKKRRRQSLDDTGNDSSIENHDGASNGSSSVSVSQPIVPPNVPLNDSRSELTSSSSLVKAKEEIMSQVPQVKQKLEPHSELMLEPKSEYIEDDMNDDSIEDLTLDDDELDMDHSRPGPSHGGQGDGSNQGFGSWQMDPSQDETFMAAQEAVGQHRDAQVPAQLPATLDLRSRSLFEPEQVRILESAYRLKAYPNVQERKILAENIKVKPQQVAVWFQNRRMKSKRNKEKINMVDQLFSPGFVDNNSRNMSENFRNTSLTDLNMPASNLPLRSVTMPPNILNMSQVNMASNIPSAPVSDFHITSVKSEVPNPSLNMTEPELPWNFAT